MYGTPTIVTGVVGAIATLIIVAVMVRPGEAFLPSGNPGEANRAPSAGEHYLIDNRAKPGAACVYAGPEFSSTLLRLRVRPPVLYAQDRRDAKVDRQTVGWRFVVEGSADGVSWTRAYESSIQRAGATDHTPAVLKWRRWRASRIDYHMRVVVIARWYRDGKVVAKARMVPRYYLYQPLGLAFKRSCVS